MQVHLYASQQHYAEHLLPIYRALPAELQGERWCQRPRDWRTGPLPHPRRRPPGLVLVAGYADACRIGAGPLVYVEHGAGQAYTDAADNGSYSGGLGLDQVALFVAPGEHVAARWRARYPATPVAVVGCPKLDRWHTHAPWIVDGAPTVAVTFHWDCGLVPETRSAVRHYQPALAHLRDSVSDMGGVLLGHSHPRAWAPMHRLWASLGVPSTADLADVLDRADVLVADNTSALYEFASLDRPVLALNAPWYRRDVQHGLRFWSHVPGLQVDEPDQLADGVAAAWADPPSAQALRTAAVALVYAHRDGTAAARAAAAIVEVHCAQPQGAPA